MGRHSGTVCTACQVRILVRDGRLIDHWHQFPTLGKTMMCVGSQSKAPDDFLDGAVEGPAVEETAGAGGRPRQPFVPVPRAPLRTSGWSSAAALS